MCKLLCLFNTAIAKSGATAWIFFIFSHVAYFIPSEREIVHMSHIQQKISRKRLTIVSSSFDIVGEFKQIQTLYKEGAFYSDSSHATFSPSLWLSIGDTDTLIVLPAHEWHLGFLQCDCAHTFLVWFILWIIDANACFSPVCTYFSLLIHRCQGSDFIRYILQKETLPKKNGIFWEFFPGGGGVFSIPKTFVNLPSNFLYAKMWKFLGGGPLSPKIELTKK